MRFVDLDKGLIKREIFSSQEIYDLEQEKIFGRCWLFLGSTSQFKRPGDYLTTFMGEEPVIVTRTSEGRIEAMLNSCPHRGNKVCLFHGGNASSFTCSYHGWQFGLEGSLIGVPHYEEAYRGEMDKGALGLRKVPRVETYGSLIFGCWDAEVIPLEQYLGEMRWYLDHFVLAEDLGGLEFLPGCQRYEISGNWKIASDNFAGDHYHTPYAHASVYKIGLSPPEGKQTPYGYFGVSLQPAHGIGGVWTNTETQYRKDLERAQKLGQEIVEWVNERYGILRERLKDVADKPYGISHGNIFPTFNLVGFRNTFSQRGIFQWHPKGPVRNEAWNWCAVEKNAPKLVKDISVVEFTMGQSAGGLFSPDDDENFQRVGENTATALTKSLDFHYTMGLGYDDHWPGKEEWRIQDVPGNVIPRYSEVNQRKFYQFWAELMGR